MCVSDAKKRRELLEDFLFWYFDGFVSPLLKVGGPGLKLSKLTIIFRQHSTLLTPVLTETVCFTLGMTIGMSFVHL